MNILKTLLLVAVLPPVNLAVLALVGLLLMRPWPRAGRGMALAGVVALLLLALPIVSGSMMLTLERGLPTTPPANDPPKAIVVLGAEITRAAGAPFGAIAGKMTLDRLRAGAELYRRTGLPVLVSGGTLQPDLPTVGALMARSMTRDFQVPVQWSEVVSKDTWENATLSAAILKAEGIHSVYVVTHAWHMPRALQAFAAAGLTATAAPTVIEPPMTIDIEDFIPRASSWETAYFVFHEWVGMARYALR